jgi:hypothetical protein
LTSQEVYDTVPASSFNTGASTSMSNTWWYHHNHSLLAHFADQIVALELIWPFPLLGLGVLSINQPALTCLAFVLALLPWLARWLIFGRLTRRSFIGGALLLLLVSGLIGVWASYDPALSWPLFLTMLGSVSLFFAIINTHVSARRVAGGLVVAAALLAFYFVGQYGYFDYSTEVGRLANLGRMTSSLLPPFVFFTPRPNATAAFLESIVLLSLVLAGQARGGERLAWGTAAALIGYALLISSSRGAWMALAAVLAMWTWLLIPNRTLRLALGGLGLSTAVLAIYALVTMAPTGSQLPVLSSILETANSRLILYRNSLYLLGDYPFTGLGLGDTFTMLYSRYQLLIPVPFLTYSHNLFLSVGLGLGGLGLIALVWLLAGFYAFVIRVERADGEVRYWPLFRAAWLGATVTFIHGLSDAPQFAGSGWSMPMLFAVLGLTVALGRSALNEDDRQETEGDALYRRGGWLALAAVAAILFGLAAIFWRPLMGAWYANLGALQQTQAELSPNLNSAAREAAATQAVNYFARALNLVPAQATANQRLGLMALNRENFETATVYLEQAYQQEPKNQATLKALGYAYLWTGQPDSALKLLQQIDDQSELVEELDTWSWWWSTQNRADLSKYSGEMAQRLSVEP